MLMDRSETFNELEGETLKFPQFFNWVRPYLIHYELEGETLNFPQFSNWYELIGQDNKH